MFITSDLEVKTPDGSKTLLNAVNSIFPRSGMHAIVGPSGCGKTTLAKALLGLVPSAGHVEFRGQTVHNPSGLVGLVGFAPQFSIANPKLSVEESISFSLDLFVRNANLKHERLQSILDTVGLGHSRKTKIENLSGGQLRRLGLGLELVNDPDWLVCDEVTSGLDPHSEDQILDMLRHLAQGREKNFICIIHNLSKLSRFDLITVLSQGVLLFQGTYSSFLHHFDLHDPLHLYERLTQRSTEEWKMQWEMSSHRSIGPNDVAAAETNSPPPQRLLYPTRLSQTWTLLFRRWQLFWRDRGNLVSMAGITFGFPALVAIFAMKGLPQIGVLALDSSSGFLESLQQSMRHQREASQAANLVVGLVLFQVILLGLTGANNSAREIAGERLIFEKERMNGLHTSAYAASKILFFGTLSFAQGAWMAVFVKLICRFPGHWTPQVLALGLSCVAMTLVSLGISSTAKTSERASFSSVFLVGLQLPLSGVVLALPDYLLWACRPFITAFWAWGGYFSAMTDSRIYDAFRLGNERWLPSSQMALFILATQAVLGIAITAYGCKRLRWEGQ